MGGEDLRDGHAGGLLDLFVAVDEGRPSRAASRRPTVVLPAPIMPTSTIGASARAAAAVLPACGRGSVRGHGPRPVGGFEPLGRPKVNRAGAWHALDRPWRNKRQSSASQAGTLCRPLSASDHSPPGPCRPGRCRIIALVDHGDPGEKDITIQIPPRDWCRSPDVNDSPARSIPSQARRDFSAERPACGRSPIRSSDRRSIPATARPATLGAKTATAAPNERASTSSTRSSR